MTENLRYMGLDRKRAERHSPSHHATSNRNKTAQGEVRYQCLDSSNPRS